MIDFLSVGIGKIRYFGNPFQVPIKSKDELIAKIIENNNHRDCFVSLCEVDKDGNIFSLFFLVDLDSKDGNQDLVNSDAAKILNWCEKNNVTYICDESGHKGIHVLMELNQTHRYHNNHFKDFYYYLLNELKLKTIDSCCCEVRRLCRIPETIHPISKKLCCTLLKYEGEPLNLFDFIENVKYKNNEFEYEVKDYSCSTGESKFIFPFDTDFKMPCIFEELKQGETSHKSRWMWVKLMQFKGYSFKEIFDLAKKFNWNDFSSDITSYQISYTLSNNYTIKCSKDICKNECKLRKNLK